jgi:hypothetical protein
VGRKDGHQWGNSWPPLGRTRWPLTTPPVGAIGSRNRILGRTTRHVLRADCRAPDVRFASVGAMLCRQLESVCAAHDRLATARIAGHIADDHPPPDASGSTRPARTLLSAGLPAHIANRVYAHNSHYGGLNGHLRRRRPRGPCTARSEAEVGPVVATSAHLGAWSRAQIDPGSMKLDAPLTRPARLARAARASADEAATPATTPELAAKWRRTGVTGADVET